MVTTRHPPFGYAEFPRGCTFNPNRASTSRLVFNNPPKPYTTLQECSSESKCVCRRTCQPGTYPPWLDSVDCKSCNTNQYQSESGKDACETCPSGQEPLRRSVIKLVVVVVVCMVVVAPKMIGVVY